MSDNVMGLTPNAFGRTMRAVQKSERRLPDVGRRTRRVIGSGGSGGGSVTPYIITEEAYGGGNVLLHRCSEPFSVQRCESAWVGDGNDVEMSSELLQGVTATGCVVTGQSMFGDLYATGGGQASSFLARCVTDEEILPGDSGSITVTYLMADETEAEATLGNVTNNAGLTAAIGVSVGVLYDSLSCTFSIFDIGCSG